MIQSGQPKNKPQDAPGQQELDGLFPIYRFRELHRRRIDLPIDRVWRAAFAVTPREVRLLGPLTVLRELPTRVRRRDRDRNAAGGGPLLDAFLDKGHLLARRDTAPRDGRALVLVCGAARFWSPTNNAAARLNTVDEFLAFDTPRVAKMAFALEAIDRGDHTELITETRVQGTDRAANHAFACYWALIRGPSGLIRRSWLAAIARRAAATAAEPMAGDVPARRWTRSEHAARTTQGSTGQRSRRRSS